MQWLIFTALSMVFPKLAPLSYPANFGHLPDFECFANSPEGGANLELRGAILAPTTVQMNICVMFQHIHETACEFMQWGHIHIVLVR